MSLLSANPAQENIINNTQTPAAVIAGPGTGKTFTISQLVVDLVANKGIDISKILITTFTKKAAAELNTRIISNLKEKNIKTELKDLKIGNFHNIANSYLSLYRHPDRTFAVPKSLDNEQEGYFIQRNLDVFEQIPGFSGLNPAYKIKTIQDIFQKTTNNLLDIDQLNDFEKAIYEAHYKILRDHNLVNFQLILKDFYDLLADEEIREEIQEDIDFVIIDEYQDTNYIQQEIAFKLVKDKNIVVFGDDDQSLYSFRGADPKNLTDFDKICRDKLGSPAQIYKLDRNYRSYQDILDFSNAWISQDFFNNRYEKNLLADKGSSPSNSVVSMNAYNTKNIVRVIKDLSETINLKQIAFLFPSLKTKYAKDLERALEEAGIATINHNVSNFFNRKEIRLIFYIFAKTFTSYPAYDPYKFPQTKEGEALEDFENYIRNIWDDKSFHRDDLTSFIEKAKKKLWNLSETFYRALEISDFQEILSKKLGKLATDRAQNNLATFSKKIAEFEELFCDENSYIPAEFIYGYMFFYYKTNTIKEFEDSEDSYNAVNFMTIHSAKGLEFDLVFVSSLYEFANLYDKSKIDLNKDFYRKYYTAFTRAKNLLVLLDNSADNNLAELTANLPSEFDLEKLGLVRSKEKKEKPTLAFTTDIEVYSSCPLKYKFLRKLNFTTAQTKALAYGSIVHKLAEDIVNARISGKDMSQLENFIASDPKLREPLQAFIDRNFKIIASEVNYKADRDFYILQGNIDAITADNSLMDIKTGGLDKKTLVKYQKQLVTYKNLMVLNGDNPNDLYLYFINHNKIIKVSETDFSIEEIDRIAEAIVVENFYNKTDDLRECSFCPMKFYCGRD